MDWSVEKQQTPAQSTCEAEMYAITVGANDGMYFVNLMTEVGIPVNMPHNIYVDNTAAGQNAEQHMNNKKTKHVAFKHLVVRDLVERGIFEMFYIPTDNNVADIGTKPLKSEAHWKHLRTLLNYTDK